MFQYLNDSELYEAFEFCKEIGIVPLIHAENLDISERVAEKLQHQGVGAVDAYETSRNDQLEAEYVHRACVIANQVKKLQKSIKTSNSSNQNSLLGWSTSLHYQNFMQRFRIPSF